MERDNETKGRQMKLNETIMRSLENVELRSTYFTALVGERQCSSCTYLGVPPLFFYTCVYKIRIYIKLALK